MIPVQEAVKIIQSSTLGYKIEKIPFTDAVGQVLHTPVIADRDFPPFDRVTMDGIAINISNWNNGHKTYRIEGVQPAGSPLSALNSTENCIEVMTGAILPTNTDCVIRYEDLDIKEEDGERSASITINTLTKFQNIHKRGLDRKQKDILIHEGSILSAPDVGVLTTVGASTIEVRQLGKVAIIATGDELVDVEDTPEDHQIRMSNVYAIQSAIHQTPLESKVFHLNDNKDVLRKELEEIFEEYEIIILSGGVSKGKFDFVPEILQELGVKKLFHKIKQRPGKPFWFGRSDRNVVFALPGNPVSAFMCFNQYFIPWYYKSLGLDLPINYAKLTEDFEFKPDLTYFLQVKLNSEANSEVLATPLAGHGSGDHANLLDTDAFLILPDGRDLFRKDEVFPFIPFR